MLVASPAKKLAPIYGVKINKADDRDAAATILFFIKSELIYYSYSTDEMGNINTNLAVSSGCTVVKATVCT